MIKNSNTTEILIVNCQKIKLLPLILSKQSIPIQLLQIPENLKQNIFF